MGAKTHGKSRTSIYDAWKGMRRRCYSENYSHYDRYGNRADHKVIVCEKWLNSFEAFYDDVSKLPHFGERGYSLDRIDNNGDYEPNNVQWATQKAQMNNMSRNRFITYKGKTQTISQWAEETGIDKGTLRYRLLHWDIERAFETPTQR